jgi:hypothetical protein
MAPVKRALPVLALVAACAHAPVPAPPPAPPPVLPAPALPPPEVVAFDRVREDVDALLAAQAEATWAAWTTGAPLDLSATWKGREWLRDGGALRALDAAPPPADAAERSRRKALRDFLVGEALSAATAPVPAEDLTFPWDGRVVSLRDGPSLLAAEADAARRAALDDARAPAATRAARLADTEAAALAAATSRLGMGSPLEVATSLRGASADALASLAAATLDATGPAYCAVMDALSRAEVGVPLASTRMRDLPRILRAAHDPRAHPAGRLLADGAAAASAAGADLRTRVHVDDRAGTGKSQRPLAVPVRVPDDVRLSVLPSGGASESRAFLHELGVALAWSGIQAQGVEARRLGTPAASATWGALLEALSADPAWIHDRSGIAGHELAREIKASQAQRLHSARMLAARILREVERSRGSVSGGPGDAPVLSRVLCRKVSAEDAARWPVPRDPLLASADALRGVLLAAQLEVALAEAGAGPWWRWKGAPAWLQAAWAPGAPASADELARALSLGAPSPSALGQVAKARIESAGW